MVSFVFNEFLTDLFEVFLRIAAPFGYLFNLPITEPFIGTMPKRNQVPNSFPNGIHDSFSYFSMAGNAKHFQILGLFIKQIPIMLMMNLEVVGRMTPLTTELRRY
jgi:hypothetical protein